MSGGPGNWPLEYGYFEAYCSTSTTCSGAQIVAKPSRSAAIATLRSTTGSTVAPMPTAKKPIFMGASPPRRAVPYWSSFEEIASPRYGPQGGRPSWAAWDGERRCATSGSAERRPPKDLQVDHLYLDRSVARHAVAGWHLARASIRVCRSPGRKYQHHDTGDQQDRTWCLDDCGRARSQKRVNEPQ